MKTLRDEIKQLFGELREEHNKWRYLAVDPTRGMKEYAGTLRAMSAAVAIAEATVRVDVALSANGDLARTHAAIRGARFSLKQARDSAKAARHEGTWPDNAKILPLLRDAVMIEDRAYREYVQVLEAS